MFTQIVDSLTTEPEVRAAIFVATGNTDQGVHSVMHGMPKDLINAFGTALDADPEFYKIVQASIQALQDTYPEVYAPSAKAENPAGILVSYQDALLLAYSLERYTSRKFIPPMGNTAIDRFVQNVEINTPMEEVDKTLDMADKEIKKSENDFFKPRNN